MFDFVRCCRCHETVRLPDSTTSWVRCPHCNSEYPIDKVLDQLPPPLQAIAAPAISTPQEPDEASGTDSYSNSAGGNPRSRGDTTLVSAPRPRVVVDEGGGSRTHVRSPEALRAERKKAMSRGRNQGGILKVVFGGLAGLLIGQAILWWLPQPYRTDPLKLAPKLPSALAFLAPASIRGEAEPLLLPEEAGRERSASAEPMGNSDAPDVVSPEVNEAAKPMLVEPANSTRPQEVVLGATDTPSFSATQLRESLDVAKTADRELNRGQNWDEPSMTRWYAPLRELAHCVTYADTSEPDLQFAKDTKVFVGRIASDKRKRSAISKLAATDLANATHNRSGILVPGTVDSIKKTEHFFETKLSLADAPGKAVDVLSRVDPRKKRAYTEGSEVLILGVVVADPSLYLPGYEGTADAIVFGGLPVRVK